MTTAISLDIETLSTGKNAIVLSIGAVRVNEDGALPGRENSFYMRLDLQEQLDRKREMTADTLKWWLQQDPKVIKDTFLGRTQPVARVLHLLRDFIAQGSISGVYTKGPAFDGAILEDLAECFGVNSPWSYRMHRDIRTLSDVFEFCLSDDLRFKWYEAQQAATATGDAHNALDDAIMQGRLLGSFMKLMRENLLAEV